MNWQSIIVALICNISLLAGNYLTTLSSGDALLLYQRINDIELYNAYTYLYIVHSFGWIILGLAIIGPIIISMIWKINMNERILFSNNQCSAPIRRLESDISFRCFIQSFAIIIIFICLTIISCVIVTNIDDIRPKGLHHNIMLIVTITMIVMMLIISSDMTSRLLSDKLMTSSTEKCAKRTMTGLLIMIILIRISAVVLLILAYYNCSMHINSVVQIPILHIEILWSIIASSVNIILLFILVIYSCCGSDISYMCKRKRLSDVINGEYRQYESKRPLFNNSLIDSATYD